MLVRFLAVSCRLRVFTAVGDSGFNPIFVPLPLMSELVSLLQVPWVGVLYRWSLKPRLHEVPEPDCLADEDD